MNKKLETRYNRLEGSRKAMFEEIKSYPDEIIGKQPALGKWSVAQVMEHVMAAEGGSLKYLQKKTLDTSRSRPAGISGMSRLLLTKIVFYAPLTFRAPKVTEPSSAFTGLSEIESRWSDIRTQTYELISKLPDTDLEKELWKHIIAGKMNIYQMLEFHQIHFDRHHEQIRRTLKAVNT